MQRQSTTPPVLLHDEQCGIVALIAFESDEYWRHPANLGTLERLRANYPGGVLAQYCDRAIARLSSMEPRTMAFTPEIEICCVCRIAQIEIATDADYDFETGSYVDCTAIKTPGAVDGRELNHNHSEPCCYVCSGCAPTPSLEKWAVTAAIAVSTNAREALSRLLGAAT